MFPKLRSPTAEIVTLDPVGDLLVGVALGEDASGIGDAEGPFVTVAPDAGPEDVADATYAPAPPPITRTTATPMITERRMGGRLEGRRCRWRAGLTDVTRPPSLPNLPQR